MLKKITNTFVKQRHPWRDIKFDELAEVYTSMSLRSFGFSLIGVFVPVYLYQNGVSLQDIMLFFVVFFLFRVPLSYISARIIARIGPKHAIAVSTVLFIIFLLLLLSYNWLGWPLAIISIVYAASMSLFFMGYNTDFSKIQHKEHGGKELGWMFIYARAGSALGPVVGGLIAGFLIPELTIVLAVLVVLVSLIPLFLTNEPVKLHQHLKFNAFPHKEHTRDYVSLGAENVINVSNNIVWPLLLAVFIFTTDSYQKLGLLVGATMAISMFTAYMYGKFIDNKKGGALLNYGVGMNFVMQISRSLVTTAGGAVGVAALGEPVMMSMKMPMFKAYFDSAGSIEGYRIVYLMWGEIWTSIAKLIFFLVLFVVSLNIDPVTAMRGSLFAMSFVGLIMLVQRFPTLKKV